MIALLVLAAVSFVPPAALYASTYYTDKGITSTDQIIINTGNVEIGTVTNPGSKLQIDTASASDGVVINGTGGTVLRIAVNSGAGSYNPISQSGDRLLIYAGSAIGSPGGGLTLAPWSGSASGLRLDAGGNVGIGTGSPESGLHVEKNAAGAMGGDISLSNKGGGTNAAVAIDFGVDNSTVANGAGNAQIKALDVNGTNNATDLLFSTWNGSAFGERVRLAGSGNVGIANASPAASLDVVGAANVWSGSRGAVPSGYMAAGSLTIGNTGANFGGGSGWNASTAGLLLEASDNTEIAVHDSGTRVASLMYYEGAATNRITLGRDMAWGAIGSVNLNGSLLMGGNTAIDSGGGWQRTYGQTGWYNGTYAGGWYMTDADWVRAYNSKSVYTPGTMQADAGFNSNGNINMGASQTISSPGRMHWSGSGWLYLKNPSGVIVSKAWGGNGNLTIEGNLYVPNHASSSCDWYGFYDEGCSNHCNGYPGWCPDGQYVHALQFRNGNEADELDMFALYCCDI